MNNLITAIFNKLKEKNLDFQKFLAKLMGKKYLRTGQCKACGRCCKHIYVRHSKHIIKDEEEFKKLIPQHFFYSYLKVIDKTDTGLVFKCTKLDEEKGTCTAYSKRALLCHQYPLEEVFMMGGTVSEDCGYKFTPIESFEEVLAKVKKSKKRSTYK